MLLAGGSRGGLRTAAAAIEKAVPHECTRCYLHLKVTANSIVNRRCVLYAASHLTRVWRVNKRCDQGDEGLAVGGEDAAGLLQTNLAAHLAACPHAVVHIEAVHEVHADVLPVLLSAMSEQVTSRSLKVLLKMLKTAGRHTRRWCAGCSDHASCRARSLRMDVSCLHTRQYISAARSFLSTFYRRYVQFRPIFPDLHQYQLRLTPRLRGTSV